MLTTHCPCRASRGTVLASSAWPVERTIVGAWCTAGVVYGVVIGGVVGAAVVLLGGWWVAVFLGVFVGVVVGAILGLVVGAANGRAQSARSKPSVEGCTRAATP